MRKLRETKRGQVRIRKFKHNGRLRHVSSFSAPVYNTNTETLHYHHLGITE